MKYLEQIMEYEAQNERDNNEKRVILEYIKKFSDTILTRDNEFAHITSSGFIMNPGLSKVLFIHHNIYNTWTWTGGHADGDEDLLYIAIKEAKEETGLVNITPLYSKIASLDIIPVWPHYKNGKYICSHMHLNSSYILIADENEELIVNNEETTGVKWIQIEEMSRYSNEPYIISIFDRLIELARTKNGC